MNAAKKGIILFLWLVVMTVATATASIPHTSENRVWGKIASGAELRPFTALQVAELQWDEKPFRLKLALDQTYPVNGLDPDGRCIEGASAAFAGAPSPGNSSGAFDAGYSGEMETAAATSSIAGSLLSLVSPNTDMNGAAQFASSVGTVYNDSRTTGDSILGATLLATGYGLTSWNIGSIYQGVYNVNVLTSQPLGGWAEQTQSIVSGIGGTAGVAAGGLGLYNGITVGAATTAADAGSTFDQLSSAATRAANNVGTGSGPVYGTLVHSAFADEVGALGNPNLFTEQSYLNGAPVQYGTPGSIRIDVGEGTIDAPTAVYDLKTGSATLTPARIQQIQLHLPGGSSIPVYEVRP